MLCLQCNVFLHWGLCALDKSLVCFPQHEAGTVCDTYRYFQPILCHTLFFVTLSFCHTVTLVTFLLWEKKNEERECFPGGTLRGRARECLSVPNKKRACCRKVVGQQNSWICMKSLVLQDQTDLEFHIWYLYPAILHIHFTKVWSSRNEIMCTNRQKLSWSTEKFEK